MSNTKQGFQARWICAGLFVLTLLLYWPVRQFDFINYDDPAYVTRNKHVKAGLSGAGVAWALTTGAASNWHPATWISHMTDVQLFGLVPGRHHLTNALLHALNAALLFLVVRRLTRTDWPGFFVAALFAWHPLRVESVAWISERKDVLSMLFFLVTLWLYARYVETRRAGAALSGERSPPPGGLPASAAFYTGALLSFTLGLMSKPMLVTVPFVLLLLDFWPLRRAAIFGGPKLPEGSAAGETWPRLISEKIPFIVLSLASCVATYLAQSHGGAVASLQKLSLGERLANAVVSYGFYLRATFWPKGLAIFYPHPHAWPAGLVLGCACLLAAISGVVWWQARPRPYLLAGWLWFLGTLVPVIGIVQVGDQAYADRYTYLPSIGIAIAVVWLCKDAAEVSPSRRKVAAGVGGLALAASLLATRQQLNYWQNAETVFQHARAVTQRNYVALNCLGDVRQNQKRLRDAKELYLAALEIEPLYAEARINVGRLLTQLGELDDAIVQLETAMRLKPGMMLPYFHLGVALGEKGRYDEAAAAYREALRLEPEFANAHYNLGLALDKLRRPAEAEAEYREAIRLDSDLAYARYSLALALRQSGRLPEAAEQLKLAVASNPDYLPARQELGRALLDLGRAEEAVLIYENILRTQSNSVVAHNNLGLALARSGQLQLALSHFAEVVRLDGSNFGARFNLASAYFAVGDYTGAATNYSQALRLKPGDTNVLARLAECEARGAASGREKSP